MDRYQWLRSLILRVAGPKADTERLVEVIGPTLIDIGADAFTEASLSAIGKTLRTVTSATRVRKALFDYHTEQARQVRALPGDDNPELTIEDRIIFAIWLRHRADGFSHNDRGSLRQRMTISLDIARLHHARVFRHICRTDLEAASIAVQRGWQVEPEPRRDPTPEEREHVSRVSREAIAAMRAGPLFHAPGDNDLGAPPTPPTPRHLDAATLDRINPLPNGRKRTDAATATASTSAAVHADPEAAGMAWADSAPANDGDDWSPDAA
jgi:hypothetical protein